MSREIEREYFYYLDAEGRLYHEQTEHRNPQFLKLFFRNLRPNTTGRYSEEYPYISPCGKEMNYLKPADTPIVFTMEEEQQLFYAPSLSVPFESNKLRFSSEGVLYHPAPVGEWGRISGRLLQHWLPFLRSWGPWYCFRRNDRCWIIQPLEPDPRYHYIPPNPDSVCMACGPQNPENLQMHFLWDTQLQAVRSWYTPPERFQGHRGWVHGGIIALLLDEVMGKLLSYRFGRAATIELNVQYHEPVRIGEQYEIRATLQHREHRHFWVRGIILPENADEQKRCATATGQFLLLSR